MQIARDNAARLLLGAALALGSACFVTAAVPAFAQESGHDGPAAGSAHPTGGHETGSEHTDTGGCSGGGCSGEEHEGGSGGHKGGAEKGGHKGATVDRTHGGSRRGGIKGHVFDQPEVDHGTDHEADANRGPHPGGNPAEKDGEPHDHESGGEEPH